MSRKNPPKNAEHKPTEKKRDKVRHLKLSGLSNAAIARAMGITCPTLRKHYRAELAQNRVQSAPKKPEKPETLEEIPAPAELLDSIDQEDDPAPPAESPETVADQVREMAGYGLDEDVIARIINLTPAAVRERFSEELADGKALAIKTAMKTAFTMGTRDKKPVVSALLYWLRSIAGYNDNRIRNMDPTLPPKQIPPGKKEQQQRDAERVGSTGRFKMSQPPHLVIDNDRKITE